MMWRHPSCATFHPGVAGRLALGVSFQEVSALAPVGRPEFMLPLVSLRAVTRGAVGSDQH